MTVSHTSRAKGSNTAASSAGTSCLHQLLEDQVLRSPQAPALVSLETTLTYDQLNRRANRLAHYLQASGVGPESAVGLWLERSAEMVLAMLAVLKAGACYVPLDTTFPEDRLEFMIDDARVSCLITVPDLRYTLPDEGLPIHVLDGDWDALPARDDNPDNPVDVANRAYVIYTSGSTGRPKGVSVTHGPVAVYVGAAIEHYRIQPGDRVLQFCSMCCDMIVKEIYPTLAGGATLVLSPHSYGMDDEELQAHIESFEISNLILPMAYWHRWTKERHHSRTALPSCLKLVNAGGERANPAMFEMWRQLAPGARWLHTYGATETTVVTSFFEADPASPLKHIPLGHPISEGAVFILDADLEPVAPGEVGELCVAGCLARCYTHKPGLTAARFLPHPFPDHPGDRIYGTGDLVRLLPDGQLEFAGRNDHQIKIRGFRVEPSEVEACLSRHPAVTQVAVRPWQDSEGEHFLAAYIVPLGGPVSKHELRSYLRDRLPEYLVPQQLVSLDALPHTPTGKLDRRALPKPEKKAETDYVAPANDLERDLADIWEAVLDVKPVGTLDNFFDLGGHSLSLVQLSTRIRERLSVRVPLVAFFEHPTVASLARHIGD